MIVIESLIIDVPELKNILKTEVRDVFKRVSGLYVEDNSSNALQKEEEWFLTVSTQGDYVLSIILSADSQTLRTVVTNMRHGTVTADADIPIYITELFNILCGHVVSVLNMKNHVRARFGIPQFVNRSYVNELEREARFKEVYYFNSDAGAISVEVILK